MITIIPYQTKWPEEFLALGSGLRRATGDLALRIDHIGSTSVPGLAAKDIIDIQITVQAFEPEVEKALMRAGYQRLTGFTTDHLPPGGNPDPVEWSKWMFKSSALQRPVNLHVRLNGHANQSYPLLFRDYLRSHPMVAEAYRRVKSALALYHPDNMDAYYDVKDPVCDIIIGGAEEWARITDWEQGPSDC
jgi:GrpB-like predicted nucleotidyltransferase (UPF0157 family)